MKRLNKNMHGDDSGYYRLPDARDLAAQYLLLYEMSLPYGLDLNNQINVDKSASRVTVTIENLSSAEIRELSERGERWLRTNAPEPMHSLGSGPMVMFAYISGINIKSMLLGSVLALVLISVLMIFALRSVKLGLISFVPNLIPAAAAFGIWGMTVGSVNLGLSIVIGMTMGIVVDDSIHFLAKYRRAREEKNLDAPDAVRYAFSTVGRALVVTSAILAIGFGILATSAFDLNASMGRMTAMTIALALLVDFLFLPPLLMALDAKKCAKLVISAKTENLAPTLEPAPVSVYVRK
jgi:predicted RND superfamily exporter protein